MTEEDTFRILKKISFDEMNSIYCRSRSEDLLKALNGAGWTYEEFRDEINQRWNRLKSKRLDY